MTYNPAGKPNYRIINKSTGKVIWHKGKKMQFINHTVAISFYKIISKIRFDEDLLLESL